MWWRSVDKGKAIRVGLVALAILAAMVSAVLLLLSDTPAQGAPMLPAWWCAIPMTEEG